ncbi:hypothetical protein ACQUW5_01300 [Legionella sp. CNM-1927-20]|uniref:hypothetical protein n=1 Tax=Legionella sp. CNM-1927-20 TaxID=3422221 RepID=UPI00403B151D
MPRQHTNAGNKQIFEFWLNQKKQWEKIFDGSINGLEAEDLLQLIDSWSNFRNTTRNIVRKGQYIAGSDIHYTDCINFLEKAACFFGIEPSDKDVPLPLANQLTIELLKASVRPEVNSRNPQLYKCIQERLLEQNANLFSKNKNFIKITKIQNKIRKNTTIHSELQLILNEINEVIHEAKLQWIMREQSSLKEEEKSRLKGQVELNCVSQIEAIFSRSLKDKKLGLTSEGRKVIENYKKSLEELTSEIYVSNLTKILNRIKTHKYDLGRGGVKGYSHSAFRIRNIIKEALADAKSRKAISHRKYWQIASDVGKELTGKLEETKGFTFFGWGKRTATTVDLYKEIQSSFYTGIYQPTRKVDLSHYEKSYKDVDYYIDESKFDNKM